MSAACAPLPEASRSSGRRTPQLPFERRDVALPEPPLPPLLEGRQQMLAREFVDGIRAHVEDLRHLFAVQIAVVPVEHRARSPLVECMGLYHAEKKRVKPAAAPDSAATGVRR